MLSSSISILLGPPHSPKKDGGFTLPQSLVTEFRASTLDRLGRIQAAWVAIMQRLGTTESEAELFRDVHTLKGEARLVGFADVTLLAQRLEDLLLAARRRNYRVNEDIDVLVMTAFQFIRMLVRKRESSSTTSPLDIDGFLEQIDEALNQASQTSRLSEMRLLIDPGDDSAPASSDRGRVSIASRERLGVVATQMFLELISRDSPRLRRALATLIKEIGDLDAVALMPLIRRHASGAEDVARELAKEVDIRVDGPVDDDRVKVAVEVQGAIHASLLHTLRNAVDHGIEKPEERVAAHKPRRGSVLVRLVTIGDSIVVTVSDDGAGIDIEAIRRRAEALGALSPEDAAAAPDSTLLDLTFAPGFSVRAAASTISGRGIGLDAVRVSIERLGGSITLDSTRNVGTTVTIELPHSRRAIDVYRIPSTRRGVVLAIPTTWSLRVMDDDDDGGDTTNAFDAVRLLDLQPDDPDQRKIMLARDADGGEDRREIAMMIGHGSITEVTASRICPTAHEEGLAGLEVVAVGDERMLMFQPELMFAQMTMRP